MSEAVTVIETIETTDASDGALLVQEILTLEDCLERFVHVIEGGKVIDLRLPPSQTAIPTADFDKAYAGSLAPPPKGKPIPVTKLWRENENRLTVRAIQYGPGEDRIFTDQNGTPFYNNFHFPKHENASADIKLFLDHLEYLFPQPDRRSLFLDWAAHIVQQPGVRAKFTPLLIATHHGTGRGWLVELFHRLFGLWNCSATKMNVLAGLTGESQYHNYLHQTLFCAVHETRAKRSYEIDDAVRDRLTEPSLELNLKYGASGHQRVFTRFLLMSNNSDAVKIGAEDRRIWVHKINDEPKEDADYYVTLYKALDDEYFVGGVFQYLKERDISGFNPGMRAPVTAEKMAMVGLSKSESDTALEDVIDLLPPGVGVATFAQIKSLAARSDGDRPYDNLLPALKDKSTIYTYKTRAGNIADKIRWNNEKVRVWILCDEDRWANAPRDEIRAALDKVEQIF